MSGRIASTLLVVGLTAGAASACAPEGPPLAGHSATQARSPEASPTAVDPFQHDPLAPKLLGNAAVNIILVEPKDRTPSPSPDPEVATEQSEFRSKLIRSDPTLMRAIGHAYATATYERYNPRSVSVTRVPGTVAIGCIASGDDTELGIQTDKLQNAAQPYGKQGELNVVIADQEPCPDDTGVGVTGGVDNMGTSDYPIVDAYAFSDGTFESITVHETGHAGGLLHAGTGTCKQPETIEDCTFEPVNDPLSVMSYTEDGSANQYTYPELGMLGLLGKNEIQAITGPGEYTLHTMGQDGLKVLALPGIDGNHVYISFEADPDADYDELCKRDPEGGAINDPLLDAPNLLSLGNTSAGINFACFAVNHRPVHDSLQVRTIEYADAALYSGQYFLADIVRPPRIPNPYSPQPEPGEITTGRVVYKDFFLTVTLDGIKGDQALVSVTRTK